MLGGTRVPCPNPGLLKNTTSAVFVHGSVLYGLCFFGKKIDRNLAKFHISSVITGRSEFESEVGILF